jgi:hypothetical protein
MQAKQQQQQANKHLKQTERNFNACEKKKCAALTKRKRPAERKFKKLEKEHCMSLSDNEEFYNCSGKFYTETGYEKIVSDLAKCAEKHCKKEKTDRSDAYNEKFKYAPTPSFMKKAGAKTKNKTKKTGRH